MGTDEKLDKIIRQQTDIVNRLNRVERSIIGDKEFGSIGLKHVVKKHDEWIEKHNKRYWKVTGLMGGISMLLGVSGHALKEFFKW